MRVPSRLPHRQYVPRHICQSEDFKINQIWFCEVELTMAVGRICCELTSSPLCLCIVFMTHLSLFSQPVMLVKRSDYLSLFLSLNIRAEESFPLLGQLPQLWNVIRGRFHGLPSCVYVCVYVYLCVRSCHIVCRGLLRGLLPSSLAKVPTWNCHCSIHL